MYKGVYGNLIEDLLNIGKFKLYKNMTMRMSTNERYDIYFGVYLNFVKNKNNDNVVCLFDTIYDWFRIDFSVKYVENMLNKSVNGNLYSDYKKIVLDDLNKLYK